MAISIRFSSMHNYHYQPGISRGKLQDTSGVLLRTEEFAEREETREKYRYDWWL